MPTRRKLPRINGCSLLILLLLAACGNTTTTATQPNLNNQPVTLQLEGYNYGASGPDNPTSSPLLSAFAAQYPNIKIVPHIVPVTNGITKLAAETAAGNPPDIAQLAFTELDYTINTLGAQPIDQIAPKDEYAQTMAHIYPQARQIGTKNGHLYGSPFTISTPILFYNADIFRAAGLDPNKPPTTWDEVRAYAQQIKEKAGKDAIYIGRDPATDWLVQSLLASNGGSTIIPAKKEATFNQPTSVQVFQMWQALVKNGLQPKWNLADARAAMSNGNLGMMLYTTALLPILEKASQDKYDLRTAGEPSFGTKAIVPVNSGSALFVFSKDPVKQHAAWEFLRFAASQRGYTIITSVLGYIPLRDDVLNDTHYLKPYIDKDPRILPAVKQLNHLQARVSWPGDNAAQALNVYLQAIAAVVDNGQDAQTTLDAASTRVNGILQQ